MAGKDQKRGNRELKKPKKTPVVPIPAPAVAVKPGSTPARSPRKA